MLDIIAALPASRFIDLPCSAPVRDGRALPHHPFSPKAAARTTQVAMLIGHNAQEMSFLWGNDPGAFTLDQTGYETRVMAFAGQATPDILAAYARAYSEVTPARRYLQVFSDYSLALPVMAQADRHASAGGRTYALSPAGRVSGGRVPGADRLLRREILLTRISANRAKPHVHRRPSILAGKQKTG